MPSVEPMTGLEPATIRRQPALYPLSYTGTTDPKRLNYEPPELA